MIDVARRHPLATYFALTLAVVWNDTVARSAQACSVRPPHGDTELGGAVLAYIALGFAASTRHDLETIRTAWIAMELIGWWVIVPLALTSLASGLVIALGTAWGLFRHYWVVMSLGLTVLATVILVVHMPSVSSSATIAREGDAAQLSQLGGDLGHAVGGLMVLLTITALNVFKPQGLTPYGWRKQQELQTRRDAGLNPSGTSLDNQ